MNLGSTIKSIQDIMREDDGVDGDAQRIGQLSWMLFLKVVDQREEEREESEQSYQSPLPEECRWRNWAAYVSDEDGKRKPKIPASDLIAFVNNRKKQAGEILSTAYMHEDVEKVLQLLV